MSLFLFYFILKLRVVITYHLQSRHNLIICTDSIFPSPALSLLHCKEFCEKGRLKCFILLLIYFVEYSDYRDIIITLIIFKGDEYSLTGDYFFQAILVKLIINKLIFVNIQHNKARLKKYFKRHNYRPLFC